MAYWFAIQWYFSYVRSAVYHMEKELLDFNLIYAMGSIWDNILLFHIRLPSVMWIEHWFLNNDCGLRACDKQLTIKRILLQSPYNRSGHSVYTPLASACGENYYGSNINGHNKKVPCRIFFQSLLRWFMTIVSLPSR